MQGVKLTFFPGSHLAPKYFKVVANFQKVGGHYDTHTNNFYPVTVLDRLNCSYISCQNTHSSYSKLQRGHYNGHIQHERLPKSKTASSDNDRFTFEIVHVPAHFRNGLKEELCCRFIFTNLRQSQDL